MNALFAAAASALLLAACAEAAAPAANGTRTASAASPAAPEQLALTGRVVDRANLLSPAQEAGLSADLEALERRTTDQLVVVTAPSLDGRTIEAFALTLANRWGIGQRGKDNGVLLVVAPTERKTRIEVGYGLEAILTDARAQEIVESDLVPNFRGRRWHDGIRAGARSIIATLIAHEHEPRRRRR